MRVQLRHVPSGNRNLAVKQPALFEAVGGHVLVIPLLDRKARQDRIAVMPVIVDRVAAIGEIAPHGVGEKLVLRLYRPVTMALCVAIVSALDFLQEDDVRAQLPQAVAQLVYHQPPVEKRQTFVDVVGDDVQAAAHDACSPST